MKTAFNTAPVGDKHRATALAAVDRFAEAERSDPFAARRAYAQLRMGVAEGGDFDAEGHKGTTTAGYPMTFYSGVKRA